MKMRAVNPAHQSGLGLIEVLLAVVIMSIGFLAVAKMQLNGMRYSQSAYFRSQAAMMLKDMSDRMRSNRAGVLAGSYDGLSTSATATQPQCVTDDTPCTPAQLAAKDLYEWSTNIHPPAALANAVPLLPGTNAAGTVTLNAAGVYDIAVQWTERLEGTDEVQSLTVQFLP